MFFSYSSRTVCTPRKFTWRSTLVSQRSPVYPRGQRHTAVSPPVVRHLPPWEQGTLLHLSAVHSSATTINQTDQWIEYVNDDEYDCGIAYAAQEIFDKIDVNSEALSVYYVVGKYRPVQSFGFSRVRVDSIAGVNIWRKYSFATILFCRSFDLVLSRFLSILTTVGNGNWWDVCEIIFRRARSSTLSEISDEWKRGFLSRLFSLLSFFFCFIWEPGCGRD